MAKSLVAQLALPIPWNKILFASVWIPLKNKNYFTIHIIFTTIHRPHYTTSTNFYLYLQFFQQ